MKAITLWQPWAQLVAIGAKRLETRSWATSYRGPLAIHASKGFTKCARALVATEPFWTALSTAPGPLAHRGWPFRFHEYNLPRGAVVATARLAACCEIVELAEKRITLHPLGDVVNVSEGVRALFGASPSRPFPALELAFGDFKPGRFAWVLEDVCRLVEPVPAKGRQGLWDWEGPGYATVPAISPATDHHPPAPAPSSGVPLTPATAEPTPERIPAPAAPLGIVEGMVQMAARDPRMRSGFIDVRMAFLRSFTRAVLDAEEASR